MCIYCMRIIVFVIDFSLMALIAVDIFVQISNKFYLQFKVGLET